MQPEEEFGQGLTVVVITDKTGKERTSAESREATSNISRAPRRGLPLSNLSHRDRSVRAELIEVGIIELINHNITEDENSEGGGSLKERLIKHRKKPP